MNDNDKKSLARIAKVMAQCAAELDAVVTREQQPPPVEKHPWELIPQPTVNSAARTPVVVLTEKANGLNFQDFYAQGWNDDQLIEHGYAVRLVAVPAVPPPAPNPK